MKVENEQALQRIAWLEDNLQLQAQQIAAAAERKTELSALRSSALLRFAKQHAEEEAARRELGDCRKGIEIAWRHIQELQEANTRVCLERQKHEAMDARHRARYSEHTEMVERTERCALLGAEILERECNDLLQDLKDADDNLAEAKRVAEREQQQERLQRVREHDERVDQEDQEEHEEEEHVERKKHTSLEGSEGDFERQATSAPATPATDEDLENAVMSILASSGPADAFGILADARCAGVDAGRLDRALQALKDAYLCYEASNGCFAIM